MSDPLRDRLAAALGPTYELQRLLGKGGMGSVYLARETALDRLVAVKVLPPEVTGDPETRERFRREARTAAKLTHPHIVPLYTFGEADGLLWFVMGYVAGETLAAKLERTPRMDPEIVRRVLADVADALDYAHSHGIVHRDVKPENILIEDAGGKALLADFGVARAGTGGTTLTTAGMLVGTPLYMSPEQASGERDLDGRSDIYSLGVVGYRMLAGRTPFEGEDLRSVLAAHVMQPASALPSDVPEDLGKTVMRSLAKNPRERWQEAAEFRGSVGGVTDDDEHLSDNERTLAGSFWMMAPGMYGGFFLWIAMTGRQAWQGFWADPGNFFLLMAPLMLALTPIMALSMKLRMKLTWKETWRLGMRPPRRWGFWWPGSARRQGDLWPRLRPSIRLAKNLLTGCFAAFIVGIPFLLWKAWAPAIVIGASLLGIGAVCELTAMLVIRRVGASAGISGETAFRLLGLPTWNEPRWARPEYAPFIDRHRTPTADRGVRTPGELAAEVRRVAGALPSYHSVLARDATARAAAIADRIAAMDLELAALAGEVRSDDLAAVERKVTDLGPERPDEPAARREIRQMHLQQLAVLQRLQQQVIDGQARREHLAGLLRTLYLQVSELNVETKRLTEVDTSGVREIVDRMAREVEGLREVGG